MWSVDADGVPDRSFEDGLRAYRSRPFRGLGLRVCRHPVGVDGLYGSSAASSRGRIVHMEARLTKDCSPRTRCCHLLPGM